MALRQLGTVSCVPCKVVGYVRSKAKLPRDQEVQDALGHAGITSSFSNTTE